MTSRNIRRAWLTMASVLVIGIATPFLANAQGPLPCGPTDEVAANLAGDAGEAPVLQGLTFTGTVLQIWRNPETQDWTAVLVSPNGLSCLASYGTMMMEPTPPPPAAPGDPS